MQRTQRNLTTEDTEITEKGNEEKRNAEAQRFRDAEKIGDRKGTKTSMRVAVYRLLADAHVLCKPPIAQDSGYERSTSREAVDDHMLMDGVKSIALRPQAIERRNPHRSSEIPV